MVTMVIMGDDGDDGAVGDFCGGNDGSSGASGICRTSLRQTENTLPAFLYYLSSEPVQRETKTPNWEPGDLAAS